MIVKQMLMSAVEIRAEISTYLEKVKDESFLKVVHSMLDTYLKEQEDPIISYDIDGTPRRATELTALLDAEVEAAKKGDYVTIEAFKNQSTQWGQPTK